MAVERVESADSRVESRRSEPPPREKQKVEEEPQPERAPERSGEKVDTEA